MLEELKRSDFDACYCLMERSFPTDEYRPKEEQLALLEDRRYRIYGCFTPEGSLAAFLAVWVFEDFSFLEHFAVDPVRRNGGLGSAALRELSEKLEKPLCLEVELPEGELARRRIGFYERNGFCYNDYPYVQPPISRGKQPVPLRLMSWGAPLEEEAFRHIRDTLYSQVYHVNA